MKRIRKFACVFLVLALVMLAGCGNQDPWETAQDAAKLLDGMAEDPQLLESTRQILDALIADDYQMAWDAVYEEVNATEFRRMYVEIQPEMADVGSYELVASSLNKSTTNGLTSVSVRYMMTAGEQRFFVDVTRAEGYEGLVAFHLTPYVPVETTGMLGSMEGANGLQWALLIIGLLEWGFTVWVFVNCCRHKVRRKWLWLLIVALGQLQINLIMTPEQIRSGIRAGAFLTYTHLLRYSTGGFLLLVMIPAGAIVYLCLHKKLEANYEAYMQQKEARETPPEEIPVAAAELPEIPEEET